jgi:hypothetical protein
VLLAGVALTVVLDIWLVARLMSWGLERALLRLRGK